MSVEMKSTNEIDFRQVGRLNCVGRDLKDSHQRGVFLGKN